MANQRADGQTLVGFWADENFTAKIDAARTGVARSQWLRNVIAEHLRKNGYPVPISETSAPDRTGKGGPKRKTSSSSKNPVALKSDEENFVDAIEAEADRRIEERKRTPAKLPPPPIVFRKSKKPNAG